MARHTVPVDDIAAGADLAALIGVRQNVFGNWAKRYKDFPRPFAIVARGETPLYRKSEFIAWFRARLSPEMLTALANKEATHG